MKDAELWREKTINEIKSIKDAIIRINVEISEKRKLISSKEEDINNLQGSLKLVEGVAKESINRSLQEAFKSVKIYTNECDQYSERLKTLKSELSVLSRCCLHEETEHDHHDYHNNVEYFRCLLCDKVI